LVFSPPYLFSNSVANILDLPWILVSIHWGGVFRAVSLNSLSSLLRGSVASRLGLSLIPYLLSGSVENGRGKPLVRVLLPYLLL
jgi:hypothetical protein